MTEKSERRWGLLRFTLLSLIALLAVSTIGGATYEATASARDRLMYPPPGKLIDIGGRKLHINCIGQGPPYSDPRRWFGRFLCVLVPCAAGDRQAHAGLLL